MYRLATRLRTHLHDRTRGQSLVEFALVLPIIMLLLLTALDFGRVYLGYINLQNMARIASNFAANNPTAWTISADPVIQAKATQAKLKYQNEILADAAATNCNLPIVAGKATAPAPTFTDADGDGTPEIGDTAQVGITCTFGVITPVISNIVGGSVQVSAASVFPVKTGMTAAAGSVITGTAPNAAFIANGVQAPSPVTGTKTFNVQFNDTSGGYPTTWTWDFEGDGVIDSWIQDPVHAYTAAGSYSPILTASNLYGSTTKIGSITVTNPTTVDFTFNQPSAVAPSAVTFAEAASPGGTSYDWTFGAGQGSGTGATTSHTFATAGTYVVTLTVTYPTGPVAVSKSVTVSTSLCLVPSLDRAKRSVAQASWGAAGFSGAITDGPGAPGNDYTIKTQSEVAGDNKPCTIGMVVNK